VTINGSAAPIALSVTTATTAALPKPQLSTLAALLIPLGSLTLLARRRRWVSLLLALALLGCGGGAIPVVDSSQTGTTQPTAVTTTLTVTGVSGTQTRTVALTLTVQ
jgi:hypothetical protein